MVYLLPRMKKISKALLGPYFQVCIAVEDESN